MQFDTTSKEETMFRKHHVRLAVEKAHVSRRTQVRKALSAVCIASGLVTAAVAGAANADAAVGTNAYLSTLSSNTFCNSASHKMSLGASITLDPAYAPNGAHVSFNFAFYQVDSAGRRIGTVYYTNGSRISTNPADGWSTPVFMNTTTRVAINPFVPGGGGLMSNPAAFTGGVVTWNGPRRVRTEINVKIAGATTGWRIPNSYSSYFADSTGGHWETLNDCHLSII